MSRHYRWTDRLFDSVEQRLETCFGAPQGTGRPNPASTAEEATLSGTQKRMAAGMMRVNHVGEVCAQALYQGQAMTCRRPELRETLAQAAEEENDHLRWCAERLEELESHKSYLNPAWYTGALCIGLVAGLAGDKWNLGFLAETEEQVVAHLRGHLVHLPAEDRRTRQILEQMCEDEAEHATCAMDAGGQALPAPVPAVMRALSRVMTTVAWYV